MLADEIDIVKFIYVLRIGQFISKLILKKHQRALVTSFKKYQLNDLGLSVEDGRAKQSETLLSSGIQEDGTESDFDEFASADYLSEDQLALLKEISEQFSLGVSAANLSILYEVTGFQMESYGGALLW